MIKKYNHKFKRVKGSMLCRSTVKREIAKLRTMTSKDECLERYGALQALLWVIGDDAMIPSGVFAEEETK